MAKIYKILQDKFLSSNKYDEIVTELYHNDLDVIQNNSYKDKDDDLKI